MLRVCSIVEMAAFGGLDAQDVEGASLHANNSRPGTQGLLHGQSTAAENIS